MTEAEHSVPDRSLPARTSQACQRCRSLKTRCLPSGQQGTCQRCLSAKRVCEWPEVQRRARKSRGPSRISQVEQKIDGLVAQLVNPTTTHQPSTPLVTPKLPSTISEDTVSVPPEQNNLPTPHSLENTSPTPSPNATHSRPRHDNGNFHGFLQELARIHSFAAAGPSNDTSNPHPSPSTREPEVNDHIIDDLLESGEADRLLITYRSMSVSFPFVPLAAHLNAEQLNGRKPMLFLAILLVASWKNRPLQIVLEEVYRRELADRTIARPHPSLSLLQSMLVYLYWYHFFFTPKSLKSLLSLVQLAAGLALDLGLDYGPAGGSSDSVGRFKPFTSSGPEQREAQRTWLGCFFVSSSFTYPVGKPSLIKYTDDIPACCMRLKEAGDFSTDELLLPLVKVRHIRDQIAETFNAKDLQDLPPSDARISMNMRYLEPQLRECKAQSTEVVSELAFHLGQMELHSVALWGPSSPSSPKPPSHIQITHLNSLTSCLEAGKAFLDRLLAFPTTSYALIPSEVWLRFPFILMTIAKLSFPSEHHEISDWDVPAAQDRVRLDLYLESLCYRMQTLTQYNPPAQTHPDFWLAMKITMDMTRGWYVRKVKESKPKPGSGEVGEGEGAVASGDHTHIAAGSGCPSSHTTSQTGGNPNIGPNPSTIPSVTVSDFETPGPAPASQPDMQDYLTGMPEMMDMDFDMTQFLDNSLWNPSPFSGGGHFHG